jgi:hypothetical protein
MASGVADSGNGPALHQLAALLSLMISVLSCSAEQTGTNLPPAVRFVAGSERVDTVEAEPLQALVAVIENLPPGTVVRFEATITNQAPYVLLAPLESDIFSGLHSDTTDARGQIATRIKFGTRAGNAYVRVIVPDHGLVDSARFVIVPGNLFSYSGQPVDTTILVGRGFSVRAEPVDRFGNSRSDPVAVRPLDDKLSVFGREVTSGRAGRARLELSSPATLVRDTLVVAVVPEGVLAGTTATHLVIFRTDGRILQQIPLDHGAAVMMDWSPDGSELVMDRAASFDGLVIVALDSVTRSPTPGRGWELYPEYSVDGEWIYFSRVSSGGWRIFRVRPSGQGDSLVLGGSSAGEAAAPTPAPDGTAVAYVVPGWDEVWIYTFGTGERRKLDDGHSPAWSPDGTRIAYLRQGAVSIRTPQGANVVQVSGSSFAYGLDWSSDGLWLVAGQGTLGGVFLIEAATGELLRVPVDAGVAAPAWRPN